MSLWELVEEEEGDRILEEGVPKQLKALVGVGLLAHLGGDGLQHIHYVWHPAHRSQQLTHAIHTYTLTFIVLGGDGLQHVHYVWHPANRSQPLTQGTANHSSIRVLHESVSW